MRLSDQFVAAIARSTTPRYVLGAQVRLDASTLTKLLRDRIDATPYASKLTRIAVRLGVPPDSVFDGPTDDVPRGDM